MFDGFEGLLLKELLELSLKVGLLAVIAHGILALGRSKAVSVRSTAWVVVLVLMLLLPLFAAVGPSVAWTPAFDLGALVPGSGDGLEASTPAVVAAQEPPRAIDPARSGARASVVAPKAVAPPAPRASWLLSWRALLVWLYAAGAAGMAARLVLGLSVGRRLVRTARPVASPTVTALLRRFATAAGLRKVPEVRESEQVRVPLILGHLRPTVLLPTDWPEWDRAKLSSVLAHELAHVSRGDLWTKLLCGINRCVYWFHPLAWSLARRLEALAEQTCDSLALRWTGNGRRYALHLVEVASALEGRRGLVALRGAPMANGGDLRARVRAIVDGVPPAAGHRGRGVKVALALSILVPGMLLSVVRLEARPEGVDQETTTRKGDVVAPQTLVRHGEKDVESEVERKQGSPAQQLEEIRREKPAKTHKTKASKRADRPIEKRTVRLSDREVAERVRDLGAESPLTRARAAAALRKSGRDVPEAVEPLADMLGDHAPLAPADVYPDSVPDRATEGDTSPGVEAAWALGKMGATGVDSLLDALDSTEWSVRHDAALGLGFSRSPRAVDSLQRALDDSDERVRRQAAWALGMIERMKHPEAVESMLSSEDWRTRKEAIQQLGSQRSRDHEHAIVDALSDEHAEVREQAAWALGMLLADGAADSLVGALDDSDPGVRDKAVWALGRLADRQAAGAVEKRLTDESSQVRANAAWALGMMGAAEARQSLEQAKEDQDPAVRDRAAWALRHLDSEDAPR